MPEIKPPISPASPASTEPAAFDLAATLAGTERIKRVQSDADALDFDTLRRDAIALVQQLCGREWSDYNLHDPGVTILEQLCFALTDLSYRCDFPVQDFLTGDRSHIDYGSLALYPPHEILPSAALTGMDYEKLLYDAIPEIDQIRFETNASAHHGGPGVEPDGRYSVYVKIDPNLVQASGNAAMDVQACATASSQIGQLLDRLLKRLDQLSVVIGQISENLQIRQNTLIRWRERRLRVDGKQAAETRAAETTRPFVLTAESIIPRTDHCLRQLQRQTADLSGMRLEFQAMPDFLSVRGCDAISIAQFFQELADSEPFTHVEQTLEDYWCIANTLDAPLQKLDDLLPLLENVLPALAAALDQTAVLLDGGFAALAANKQETSAVYESIVRRKILAVYCANRNLCEDIDAIHFIETVPYYLTGAIEIDPFHNPAKVYAEIYFKCSRFLSRTIQVDHYATVMAGSKDYTRLFSGPLTQHGYIRDVALETGGRGITVTELTSLIRQIDGVKQILNLALVDAGGFAHDSLNYQLPQNRFPVLQLSRVDTELYTLRLTLPKAVDDCDSADGADNVDGGSRPSNAAGGKNPANTVFADDLMQELKKLVFEYHAFRSNTQSPRQFIELPVGNSRRFNGYYSIQNYFPAIYGINRQGVPGSMPLDVHAKAKQLKAYLYPFEQLMANFAQDLQSIPELFAVHAQHNRSYYTQFLDDSRIPAIETLYRERDGGNGIELPSAIDDVLGQYDSASARKNRILDIGLALYGERFDSQRLLQFNAYHSGHGEDWIIDIKSRYLQAMRETSRDRGKGFNYCASPAHRSDDPGALSPSGLHAKIGFLLGLSASRPERITDVLLKRNSRLVSDRQLASKIKFVAEDARSEAVTALPGFVASNATTDGTSDLPSQLPVFGYSIFKAGVRLGNYRLVETGRNETLICFKTERGKKLWILSKETGAYKATVYAHQFCRTLTELNKVSENFHILEHHLLRTRQQKEAQVRQTAATDDVDDLFYRFRVSFIFPSWTARFADAAFRAFAEQTVQQQLPAHIHADFYWLDFAALQDFEQRYTTWLDCLRQRRHDYPNDTRAQLDQASAQLVAFLIDHRTENVRDYWL